MTESLGGWIDREYRYAAGAMLRSISPTGIVKTRPGFGQTIHARPGAIVASPVPAAYDPDPDYFFHWYRDSAVVIDALRLLHADGSIGDAALAMLGDFTRFSLALGRLDGRALVADAGWRQAVASDYARFVRDDAELAQVHGDAVAAEARVNADGTLDISKWARPQHDGPPLRALALLRWLHASVGDAVLDAELQALLRADLAFTHDCGGQPSVDIWEEELGLHYYTLRVSAAALLQGAAWLLARGEGALATAYRLRGEQLLHRLDDFWRDDAGHYASRLRADGTRSAKELDVAVILAAIHADADRGAHSVADPRLQATLARLAELFDRTYAINRQRPAGTQPALGRYAGDVYYSGGAYYFATLAAAEFCFRAAAAGSDAAAWSARGDGYLATVRAYTPLSGELSEQFDQHTGAQTSARHLAWSYAAFISCIAARRRVHGADAHR